MELDLYNKNGKRLGRRVTYGYPFAESEYILIAHLCIFDAEKRMLIQKRSDRGTARENLWDLSVSQFVLAGENSPRAILRGMQRYGLQNMHNIEFYISTRKEQTIEDFFILRQDLNIKAFDKSLFHVNHLRWANQAEILEMIQDKTFSEYKFTLVRQLFSFAEGRNTTK